MLHHAMESSMQMSSAVPGKPYLCQHETVLTADLIRLADYCHHWCLKPSSSEVVSSQQRQCFPWAISDNRRTVTEAQ